jgi:hypothetical protein
MWPENPTQRHEHWWKLEPVMKMKMLEKKHEIERERSFFRSDWCRHWNTCSLDTEVAVIAWVAIGAAIQQHEVRLRP